MDFYNNKLKEKMQLYEIKNEDYETKRVAATDMREALAKYETYLSDTFNADYSYIETFRKVTTCTHIGEYVQDDVIV
jgi:hypothetical protein